MTTQQSNKPDFNIVRYYGEGRNAPHGRVGAIWKNDKGNLSIVIENPFGSDRIVLTAFPSEDKDENANQ